MNIHLRFLSSLFLSGPILFLTFASEAEATEPPKTSAEIFITNQVWNIHLTFTAEQWAAIEPPQGKGPGGDHGPGGFDPFARLASAFLQAGDSDQNKSLSLEEWTQLGKKWFQEWSGGKERVSPDALAEAAGKSLMGGGPGPGGGGNGMGGIPKNTDFPLVHAALDFNGTGFADVAVRYKGNNTYMRSRHSLKRSFKIDLNRYVKGQKLGELTAINLHSEVNDHGWMNEALSYLVYREAGVPAPRTAYARVYVTVPGLYSDQYFGLYSVVENIDNAFLKDRFQSKKGALFKPSLPDLFHYAGDDWAKYEAAYDPKDQVSVDQAKRVMEFSKLVTEGSDGDFEAKAGTYLDLEKFARYMAATVWLSTLDSILALGHNYYVYLNPDSNKFELLPWDMDQSFGQFGMGGGEQSTLNIFKPWQGQKRFLERVYALPEFQADYRKDLQKFSSELFTEKYIASQVNAIAPAIRPAIAEESAEKLKSFDTLAAGQTLTASTGNPLSGENQFSPEKESRNGNADGPPRDRQGQDRAKISIKTFVGSRDDSVLSQLNGTVPASSSNSDRGPGGFPGGGPGRMIGEIFAGFDANKDGNINAAEFQAGFGNWFTLWNSDKNDRLSVEEIQAGLKALLPMRPPGGPGDRP